MAHTLTVQTVLDWLNSSNGSSVLIAATPPSSTLALIQRCIDAADKSLQANCDNLPVTYTADIEKALLLLACRLWQRRTSPSGISLSEFGMMRVSAYDADIEILISPYRTARFSFGT